MSEKYLISIAIGPVQDFIASARRSRDLWFGSWLLSELSRVVAEKILELKGELIFPASLSGNVVNKILAEIDATPETISEIGEKVKEAIDERLKDIRDEAFKKVLNKKYFLEDVAKIQVADLVEFFWTAVKRTNDYVDDRNKVEKLFSARKATRNFNRVTWGDNVPKSSLDGQRESVIHEYAYGQSTTRLQVEFDAKGRPKLTKEQLRKQFDVKEGERLCGVGLLKRHGNRTEDGSFFSTSHVASLPLLQRLVKQKQENETGDFLENIKYLADAKTNDAFYTKFGCVPKELEHPIFQRFDGHLLFKERLDEFFEEPTEAKNELQNFLSLVLGKNKEPLPYYALILADGDFMGKAIDKQDSKDNHQKLSGKLSEFAGEVRTIIENNGQGSLIYAGGDDVLAFVGLHKVLDYADKLAKDFKTKLETFKYDGKNSPTLSVGIAVVHHLEPLEDALELVRSAERAAKSVDGKNALAVVVDKRSGASRIAKGSWENSDGGTLYERLQTFIKWHRNNDIPDGAAYELRDLAYRLEIPETAPEALRKNLTEAKEKEAKRILKRKKKDFGESAIDDETIKSLEKFIKDIEKTKQPDEDSIAILADELIIAKMFADAEDQAEGK